MVKAKYFGGACTSYKWNRCLKCKNDVGQKKSCDVCQGKIFEMEKLTLECLLMDGSDELVLFDFNSDQYPVRYIYIYIYRYIPIADNFFSNFSQISQIKSYALQDEAMPFSLLYHTNLVEGHASVLYCKWPGGEFGSSFVSDMDQLAGVEFYMEENQAHGRAKVTFSHIYIL